MSLYLISNTYKQKCHRVRETKKKEKTHELLLLSKIRKSKTRSIGKNVEQEEIKSNQ